MAYTGLHREDHHFWRDPQERLIEVPVVVATPAQWAARPDHNDPRWVLGSVEHAGETLIVAHFVAFVGAGGD